MTRRFGRSRAGVWWLGVVVTLLGGASACGDDDGDGAPNGTGGASTGGSKSGSGGGSGSGGIQAGGGSSGAAPKGGSGGSSGGAKSGTGGMAPAAGEGGAPGEGGGGAGPIAGNPGGGSGGDAGSGTIAGAPSAGQPGTGGGSSGGTGGGGAGDAGSGGGADVPVEYRSCERGAAVTRVELYRIDRESGTCTLIVVQQGQINCLEGLKSGGWCVISAALSEDIEACEAFQAPSNPIQATGGTGTFTVSTQPLAIDIDVEFDFAASGDLPQTVSVEADNCLADCVANDCRP